MARQENSNSFKWKLKINRDFWIYNKNNNCVGSKSAPSSIFIYFLKDLSCFRISGLISRIFLYKFQKVEINNDTFYSIFRPSIIFEAKLYALKCFIIIKYSAAGNSKWKQLSLTVKIIWQIPIQYGMKYSLYSNNACNITFPVTNQKIKLFSVRGFKMHV